MTAWLAIVAGDNRQHGGNEGYDDVVRSYYSWDNSVGNWKQIKEGDQIVLWDKQVLLGASVIESIDRTPDFTKRFYACPVCDGRIKARSTLTPRWRCQESDCGAVFPDEDRKRWTKEVEAYRSNHAASWVDLEGLLRGDELRALATPGQQSIRQLDWSRFVEAVELKRPGKPLAPLMASVDRIAGGHKTATLRVRVGQAKFRQKLLARYNSTCAFSGPAPDDALEAAHLYSFAALAEHDLDGGGFLLRRDLHRLFDRGQLSVNPHTELLHVSDELLQYPEYSRLHNRPLEIALTSGHKRWLVEHWARFGEGSATPH
jgi:hypothetical protein